MEKYKLGDLIEIKHGYAFKSKNYVNKSQYALVTLGNISERNNFKYNPEKTTYYGSSFPEEYILKENDLIIPLTEQVVGLFGNSAFIPSIDGTTFVLNQRVGKVIIKDSKKIDKYYLHYLLATDYVKSQLEYRANGTKQRNISPEDIYDVTVFIPNIIKQEQIGNMLYRLEKKINNNEIIINETEKFIDSIFRKCFIQYDMENISNNMKYDETLKVYIPKEWDVKTIKEIESNIITGKTPSTSDKTNYGNEIPFVTIDDIRKSTYVVETLRGLSTKGADLQKNKYLPKNSICTTCIATVGLVGITTELSQTNQQINSIVCNDKDNLYYLVSAIRNHFKYSSGAKLGNIFKNMNKDDFSNIRLIYPSKEYLTKYNNLINNFYNKMYLCSQENSEIRKLQNYLIPLLLNEQLKI